MSAAVEVLAPVELWVYDLTQGMAAAMSPMLLGTQIEGVWHTSLVVHDDEWFYGYGVQCAEPGSTPFGQPLKKLPLGSTQIPKDMIREMVVGLGEESYTPEKYNLLHNNCNHFTNAMALLLVDQGIPEYILKQHEAVLSTPLGAMLMPMLQQVEGHLGAATSQGFHAPAAAGNSTSSGTAAQASAATVTTQTATTVATDPQAGTTTVTTSSTTTSTPAGSGTAVPGGQPGTASDKAASNS